MYLDMSMFTSSNNVYVILLLVSFLLLFIFAASIMHCF